MTIEKLVRDSVKRLKPFSSARAEYTGNAEVYLDANESPFESDYNRYPDPHHKELKKVLADQQGLQEDQLIFGNGSDELIDIIVRTFCQPRVDIIRYIAPTFSMYEVVADINEVGKEIVALDHDFNLNVYACIDRQTPKHKVLFLCSPNNPTGNSLDKDRLIHVIAGWDGIVVLDEAYIEFSSGPSLVSKLKKLKNLIILQTFSKAKGGAGLRLGVAYSNPEIINYLKKIKPPYNVNSNTQKRALEILANKDLVDKHVKMIIDEREALVDNLKDLRGIEKIFPSDANFLLIRCHNHKSLYNFLIQKRIIVRDRSKMSGCKNCLRFTIGLPEENSKLLALIKEFYS